MILRTALTTVAILSMASLPAVGQVDLVRTWDLEVQWPRDTASVVFAIHTAKGLGATWEGQRGRLDAKDVTFEDGDLSFVLPVEDQDGRDIELRFTGRITDEGLMGTLRGPGDVEVAVRGRRSS